MTRAASLLLRVVGLALVLVGLMGVVLLGVDGTWTARTEISAGRTAVLLEPSVVSVLGPSVTVRVEPVPGASHDDDAGPAELFLGRGRSDDLTAYARDATVARVVGLDRSRELDVRDGPGPAASGPTAQSRPPTAVDLWQQQVSGPAARELTWRPTSGAQSVLIAAEDAAPLPALDVEVAWTDRTWLFIPIAALLLGIALIVTGMLIGGGLPAWAAQLRPPQSGLLMPRPRPRPGVTDKPATVAPSRAPAPVPVPASDPAPPSVSAALPAPSAEASTDVVPTTRRAARGRRRKETVWERARSRARAAVPAGVAQARSRRSPDDADRPGREADSS